MGRRLASMRRAASCTMAHTSHGNVSWGEGGAGGWVVRWGWAGAWQHKCTSAAPLTLPQMQTARSSLTMAGAAEPRHHFMDMRH